MTNASLKAIQPGLDPRTCIAPSLPDLHFDGADPGIRHATLDQHDQPDQAQNAEEAAKALIGTKCDTAALDAMQKAASAAATPIDDKRGTKEFRVEVAGVLARRAVETALSRAKGN